MSQRTTSATTFINVLHNANNTKLDTIKQLLVYIVKKQYQAVRKLVITQHILALILALTITHILPLIVLANSGSDQKQTKATSQKFINPKQSTTNTTQPTTTSHAQPVILNNNTTTSGTSDHNNQETIPATTTINSSTIPPNDSTLLNTKETEQDKKTDSITTNAANLNKILDDRSVAKNNVPKVEESTGALSFSYPIVVPPGRNGMQPDVALNYNSQDKSIFSPYGYGWSLSVPYIKRYQPTGALNQYSTNTYEFSLGGKLVLAQTQPGNGGQAFETRLENGQHWQFLFQNDVWTVRDNLGHTYTFGGTASSRQDNPNWGSYSWMLSEISDTNNNAVRYTYTKQNGQIYPDRINYTYHPETASIYEVRFLWQDAPYPRTSYHAGFKIVTEKRLTKIIVQSNGQIIHQYSIGYQNSISNVIHLVSRIGEEYLNAQGILVAKPDTTFEYPDASEIIGWEPTNQIQFPFSSVSNGVRFSEFTGDGLVDFMHGSTLYTNGDTQWTPSNPTNAPFISNPMSGTNDGIEMLDYNSDGVTDYFGAIGNVTTNTNYVHPSNFLLNNGNGGYLEDTTNIQTPPQVTTTNFYYDYLCDHAGLRLLDLNGDGLTDMLQGFRFTRYNANQGGNQDYYINRAHFADLDNTGKISWQQQPWSPIPVFEYEASGSVSHKILEMNGDGLPDLLYFAYYTETNPRYVRYDYHANTTINWDYLNGVMLAAEAGYATSNRVADVNGDGLDDIIIAANYYSSSCNTDCDHRRKVILNHGSAFDDSPNSWQLPDSLYFVRAPSQYSADTDVNPHGAFGDVNGDGAQDIIIFQSGGNSVYLNKSAYAYLPKKIILPEGGSLSISYKGSPEYRGENNAWVNHIPFVITTVEKISTNDGFGNIGTDTYFYENGTYVSRNLSITDSRFMLERQASFGKVTLTKADGSKIITYYHQGNGNTTDETGDDIAKIGRSYRQEIYNQNGTLARATVTQWDKQDLFGANNVGHWFVKKICLVNLNYGLGGTHRDSAITYSYDPQTFVVTTETNYGEVTAGIDGTFTDIGNDKLTVTRSYVTNNQYLNSLLASEIITNQYEKVAETKHYYDNQALGQATIGNITKQEQWVSDTSPYISTQKTYNTAGFVLTETNPLGKITTYIPDSAKLYPASITNPRNQTTQYQYNYAVGRPKQITDPNGAVFIITYDALGRIVEEKTPDPITGSPVTKSTYNYTEIPNDFSVTKTDYLDTSISTQTISYLDGLGRVIQTRKQTENGSFFVSDTVYDTVGRVSKQSLPYTSPGSSPTTATSNLSLYTIFTYDGLNRTVNQTNAVSITSTTYNGWTVSVSVTDPSDPNSNHKKDLSQDAFGRIAQVVEYNQNQVYATTFYTYNGNNCLTSITDAQNNIRKFTYDGLGRRTSAEDLHHQTDATFGKWLFTYDEANNLKSVVDPKNQIIRYDYDELNRVKNEMLGSQTVFNYTYDSCTNGKGKLCQVATPSSTFIEHFKYDLLGQMIESIRTINGTPYTTKIEYDRQGNQTLITNPDNSQVKYIYNTAGLINQVQRKEPTTAFSDVITNIDYSPTEQPTLIQYGNGTTTTNTYNPDKLYRLQQKVTTAPTQPISAPTLINDKLDSSAVVGKPRLFNISTNAANPRVTISSFTANPTTITDGQSSTLQWSLTGGNPRTLTLTTDTGNTTSVVGKTSLIVNPTKTTTYTLKADNISTASVTITVTAASPTITPNGGTITATQTIALATVTTNAKIYYSTNNSTPTTASTEYTSPFTLNTLATVKAITVKPGLTQSSVASATFAVTQPPPSQVAAPSVSPNGGNFTSPVSVILSTNTIGADIYYTLDSTTPTTASTKYTEGSQGITLSQSTIVKVIAVKPGMTNSIVTTSNNFVVTAPAQVAAPSISPNGGNFTNSTSVVLSTNTTESDIYYTLDGSTPTTTSTKYIEGTQGFTLSESAVVKVIAVKLGMANSTVATSGDFTFTVAAPSISPNGGNFTVPVSVILSTTTSGADIYYTLDGGDPNTTSTKYIQGTQGFALSLPAVIKAVAVKSGMTNSTVAASNNFTFNTPTIAFGPILQDISYLYDCAGNITDIIDRSQTHSEKSVKYTYDGLNRLLNATTTTVANSQQTYALNYIYDAIGNIITRTEKIGSNPTKTYTYKYEGNLGSSYTNPHAVTSISDGTTTTTYLYDNNGNLTSAGNQIYNWSHRNEMTNVTGGATAIYEYDYTGQRIKSSNGTYVDIYPTKWYNINTVGKISKHIFAGSSMAATVETTSTTQVYTHHADHLSGQGATTSTSGSIVEILDYFPFGTTRFDDKVGSFSEQRKFAGLEHDVNTGLYYANARYYNPATGRFASQDAVFLQMGDRERIAGLVGDESLMQRILVDPQQLNSYSYARNNPITYTDKTGHAIETVADVISLALSTRDFYQNKTFWNGVFVGLDGLGLAVPFIPSGAGYIKNGAKIAKIANYFNRISDATGKSALSVTRLFAENIGFKFSRRAWSAGEAGESLGSLVGHFAKHGDEVDADNVGAYYNKANDFIDAKGTHSFGDPFPSNGDTIHYNPTTHEKAVTDKSGSIRSYYVENRTAYQSTYNSIINAK